MQLHKKQDFVRLQSFVIISFLPTCTQINHLANVSQLRVTYAHFAWQPRAKLELRQECFLEYVSSILETAPMPIFQEQAST